VAKEWELESNCVTEFMVHVRLTPRRRKGKVASASGGVAQQKDKSTFNFHISSPSCSDLYHNSNRLSLLNRARCRNSLYALTTDL
jgi:hypothetical protein